MGVLDGQAVSQSVTNPAFINKNIDDAMPNKLGFTRPLSGPNIADIQKAVNNIYTATGVSESANGTDYNATPGTVTNGNSYLVAIGKLADKFDPATGHMHTGAAGDGPVLDVVTSLAVSGGTPITGDLTLIAGGGITITESATGFTFDVPVTVSTTIAASGNPDLSGQVILVAGGGVTLTQSGQDITISASGGGGGGSGIPPTIQKFLSGSGTYTTPTSPAPTYIRVTMVGGGAGGVGNTEGGTDGLAGASGTDTTFSTMVAGGGTSGVPNNLGGLGGSASLGGPTGVALAGGAGGGVSATNSPAIAVGGGGGGSSYFGGAGLGGNVNAGIGGDGAANTGAGGGGGGGGGGGASSTYSGGGGGSGGFTDALIYNPASTYSYVVGVGGAGGTGSTANGGSGADGIILVEEFYGGGGGSTIALTDWVTFPMVISGTVSDPTKGTVVLDTAQWRRVGDSMEIRWDYTQSAAGTAGSGIYLMGIPGGYSIDSAKMPFSNNAIIATVGISVVSGNSGNKNGTTEVYDSTHLVCWGFTNATPLTQWDSTSNDFGSTALNVSITALVPIVGWTSGGGGGNPPLSIMANNPTSTVTGSLTDIMGWTEIEDTNTAFDPTTGIFTAPFAGLFGFSLNLFVGFASALANEAIVVQVSVNGTPMKATADTLGGNETSGYAGFSANLRLALNDAVTWQILSNTVTPGFANGALYNFLDVWEIQ